MVGTAVQKQGRLGFTQETYGRHPQGMAGNTGNTKKQETAENEEEIVTLQACVQIWNILVYPPKILHPCHCYNNEWLGRCFEFKVMPTKYGFQKTCIIHSRTLDEFNSRFQSQRWSLLCAQDKKNITDSKISIFHEQWQEYKNTE